jgi:HEAT repeat protein
MDEFTGEDVARALVKALSDADEAVKKAAAETLAENKNEPGGQVFIESVSSDDPFVKASCLRALRALRLPESQAIALECLEHPDASVRREAVGVLAYLKNDDVLIALMNAAKKDQDENVRRVAMGSLIFSKSDKAAETLIQGLKDDNWQVREESAFVIGKVGQASALDALIDAMNDDYWQVRVKAAGSLGKLKDPGAVAVLGQALSYNISNLRKEAAAALGEICSSDAIPFLEAAQDDVDPDVRKVAQWAIDQINSNNK